MPPVPSQNTAPAETATAEELPDWELVFRFSSGRLCLSLCATVGERWRRNFERLRAPGDLARWLFEAGLAADDSAAVSVRLLREARALREAIYRLVRAGMAGEPGSQADRDLVNVWARRPPLGTQLGANGERTLWAGPHPVAAGLAAVAVDAVELLTGPAIHRVRECAADDCALLFLDSSRPGRRRWCADGACGSKSRSAAYRARHVNPRSHPAETH